MEGVKETPLGLTVNGTAGVVMATQNFGVLPTKNWQQGTFDGWEKIHGEELTRRFLKKNSACYSCPIGCGRKTKLDDPRFSGEGEGPEYETIYAMGSNCMVDDLAAIVKANYICNEMGMDTITMGATIACAMELVDRGYLKEKVTKAYQDLSAIIDSAGLCIFFAVRNLAAKDLGVAPVGILEYLNAATGADYTLEALMQAGERIINAERLFLTRAGFSRKDDSIPDRLTRTPAPTGPAKGLVCHLDEMLDEYYKVQGWTGDGIPGKEVLERLGLA